MTEHRVADREYVAAVWCMQGGAFCRAPAPTFPTKTSFNQAETSAVANLDLHTQIDKQHSAEKLPLLREGQGGLGLRAALTDRSGRFLSSEMLSAAINTQLLTQQH